MTAPNSAITAIFAGDTAGVAELLRSNPSLATDRPGIGPSALLAAAYTRNAAIIAEVRKHAPCDLFEAAAFGDLPAIDALLRTQPGAIASYSGDGWTPLHLAAFFGHADAVTTLLRHGARTTAVARNAEANHPLHAALSGVHSAEVVQALLDGGADCEFRAGGGVRPIHVAASRGYRGVVDLLLARGADPRVATDDGRTPSVLATERGFPELARFLADIAAVAPVRTGT